MLKWLVVAVALVAAPQAYAGFYHPVDKANVPEVKRTKPGLYLTAPEAYEMKAAGGDRVAFFDIRTKGEFMFLGSPTVTDANIPYVDMEEPVGWDAGNRRYKLAHNSDFIAAVTARVEKHSLGKNAPIILMCRSGDRSARAVNLLQEAGFSKVYSVLDGFEGDLGKSGKRDVNGWKNADLPWTYQMEEAKAYLR